MTDTCACCGKPTDHAETHHVDEQRGNNHPDNLSPRDRRCHMNHHENDRATDQYSESRYGPPNPSTGPGP